MNASKRKLWITGAIVLVGLTAAAGTIARMRVHDEAANLARVKISLIDAINYAQSAVPGQSLSAELDGEREPLAYAVEIVQPERIIEVKIDAQSGKVISKNEDRKDQDNHDERD